MLDDDSRGCWAYYSQPRHLQIMHIYKFRYYYIKYLKFNSIASCLNFFKSWFSNQPFKFI